jgi:hypothetical protein
MRDIGNGRMEHPHESSIPQEDEFGQIAIALCESTLNEAKNQLHSTLQDVQSGRLDQRPEFLQAFRSALKHQISRQLVTWCPSIQTIFTYSETPFENIED